MTRKTVLLSALIALTGVTASAVDTLYIRQVDTIIIRETRYQKIPVPVADTLPAPAVVTTNEADCEDKVFFVYFPLGRYGLDAEAQKAIQQMAARLEEHPSLSVRLTGYCDYVGSEDLNDRLSVARAKNVRRQLVEVHGVDASRIVVEGKGKLDNVRAEYSPNRRVEMRLVKGGAEVQSQGTTEAKKSEVVQPQPQVPEIRLLATETVTATTTLARLARKYYGNTFCWVYIYAMNKSLIPNPDRLQVGQQIRIPELGEVDRLITKQESEEYYRMLRR